MPRKCQCCESEYRLQCDSRLKAGESPSALAAEFGLSVDALQRHAKNHLPKRGPQMTLVERLERALTRAESLVESCSQLGDHRGLDSALKSVTTIIESISKMRTQDVGKYESLSDSEKVDYLFRENDGKIPLAYIDRIIGDDLREALKAKTEAEKFHGQRADIVVETVEIKLN